MAVTGACRCKAVRYRLDVAEMPATYACHCTLCQRATGASFAHQMPVREEVIQVEGETVEAVFDLPDGVRAVHHFCARCLARIYGTNTLRPGIAIVRAGTIDGSETLTPRLHIYTSTKQPWIVLPEGVPAYSENAPMEVWRSALNWSPA